MLALTIRRWLDKTLPIYGKFILRICGNFGPNELIHWLMHSVVFECRGRILIHTPTNYGYSATIDGIKECKVHVKDVEVDHIEVMVMKKFCLLQVFTVQVQFPF